MPDQVPPFQGSVDKERLRAAIIARLELDLELQVRAARLAHDEAISEESRAQNKYDTHGQEAAYLAEGQARLAAEVIQNIAIYRSLPMPHFQPDAPIAVGSVVEVAAMAARPGRAVSSWYFIGPRAGGLELALAGRDFLVLTLQSPLGRQLLGQRAGAVIVPVGRGKSEGLKVLSVQ